MSANIKASTDGTQASIGVGGVDQMTISNAGVVTANSFVGAVNGSNVTATGSTTPRTLANRFADVVNVKDFGAVGDGVADDTDSIKSWLNYLMNSGKKGFVPSGLYYMLTPITLTVTANIDVEASDNAIFKGSSSISQYMILLIANTRETYQVSWIGGTFDISQTIYIPSSLSGSGLAIQKVWKCVIDRVRFVAANDYTTGGSFGGDTGLGIIDCRFVSVTNCMFSGQRDLGIYITGDSNISSGDGDGGDVVVSNNHFFKCAAGIAAKRQNQRMILDSNTFYYCYRGATIVATDVVTPEPSAGRRCIISNNSFAYTAKTAIQVQTGGALIIVGNRIQDIGYSLNGSTSISNSQGIIFEGVSNCLVNDNWIGYQDWTATGTAVGVLLQKFIYNAISYKCEYNNFSDNYLQQLNIGFRETPNEADYNKYQCNMLYSILDEYNSLQTNSSIFDQKFGTWEVKLYDSQTGGNVSPTTTTGYYTKIGNIVNASFTINDIVTTGMNASNILYISLPFTSNNLFGASGSITTDSITLPSGRTSISLNVPSNSNRALISCSGTGVIDSAILVSGISSGVGDIVQATITYSI